MHPVLAAALSAHQVASSNWTAQDQTNLNVTTKEAFEVAGVVIVICVLFSILKALGGRTPQGSHQQVAREPGSAAKHPPGPHEIRNSEGSRS